MAVAPIASGHPDYSASDQIPTLYAAETLVEFYNTSTYAAITNNDVEGQIKQKGDTVKIRTLPEIDVNDNVDGVPLKIQRPDPDSLSFTVDQEKYIAFQLGSVMKHQIDYDAMAKWADHGSRMLATGTNGVDPTILQSIYADAHEQLSGATAGAQGQFNFGVAGSPLAVTKSTAPDLFVDVSTAMDELNVPSDGRCAVIPPWLWGLLLKSDIKDSAMMGDERSVLRNGLVGEICGFKVYKSNNLATTSSGGHTASEVIFTHKLATAFAMQFTEKVIFDLGKDGFGKALKVLWVFGKKVVKPEALAHVHCYQGS